MYNFRKIVNISIVIIALMTGLIFTSSAKANSDEDVKYENQKFILSALNIIEEDRDETEPVNRGEVTAMIYRAFFEHQMRYANTKYSDVPAEHKYYNEIMAMSELGIVSGYNGTYEPEAEAVYNDVLAIMINALGYRIEAQQYGGYPNGYFATASKLDLLKNVAISGNADAITYKDLVKLLYNFVDTKPMVHSYSGAMKQCVKDDETLLEAKLSRCNLSIVYGILNELTPGKEDYNGKAVIDSFDYGVSAKINRELQGCAVIAVINEDVQITAIKADARKNKIITIDDIDLTEVSLESIEYEVGNGKTKTIKFSNAPVVIKNGIILSSFTVSDLEPCNGNIRLIDNNDDGDYEYVHITECEYFEVSRISAHYNVIFLDNETYKGFGSIYVDNNEPWKYCLQNHEGELIDLSELKRGDRISVCGSEGNEYICVTKMDEPQIGKLQKHNDNKITVDGVEHRIAVTSEGKYIFEPSELKLNYEYYFYIDGELIIGYEKTDNGESYGFVVDAGIYDFDSVYYKILAEDKNVYKGDLADDAKYNGKTVKRESFVPKALIPVKYTVDDEGKIDSITELEEYGSREKRKYRERESAFTSLRYNYPLFMSDKTQIFVVPTSGETLDYCANLKLSDNGLYSVRAFDYDEDTYSVGVIVIYDDVKYETTGMITNDAKPVMLISNDIVLDEEDNTVHQLTWLEGKETKTYYVKNTAELNKIANEMKAGDVFRYSLSSIDLVDNIELLLQPSQSTEYFHHGANTITEKVYGKITGGKFNIMPKGSIAHAVNVIDLETNDGTAKSFLVSSDEEIYYYLYDGSRRDKVSEGDFSDVMFDTAQENVNQSDVFLYMYDNQTQAVVIVN